MRYGDKIRLFTKSLYVPDHSGGYVGYIDSGGIFRHSKHPDKQGDIACIPPLGETLPLLFHESVFTILPAAENDHRRKTPVSYGAPVVLIDERQLVWNNKIGIGPTSWSGYIGPRSRSIAGEMFVTFKRFDATYPISYGDNHVSIQVIDSHRTRRSFNQDLTHYWKPGSSVLGGYICCDGKGESLLFQIHGLSAPSVSRIYVRGKENVMIKRKMEWGESFLISERLIAATGRKKSTEVVVELSDRGWIEIPTDSIQRSNGRPFYLVTKNTERPARVQLCCVLIRQTFEEAAATRQIDQKPSNIRLASQLILVILLWGFNIKTFVSVLVISLFEFLIRKRREKDYQIDEQRVMKYKCTLLAWEGSKTERIDPKKVVEPPLDRLDLPKKYLVAENGNLAAATERYKATLAWRKKFSVDTILSEPQVHYSTIRQFYTQYVHKTDRLGHPIYIEQLGTLDLKALTSHGVSMDALFRHYIFNMEYIMKNCIADRLCPCPACVSGESCKMVVILDVKGIGWRDLAGDTVAYVRKCTSCLQEHYPQQSYKIFIINVPTWFGMTWKIIKPMLNESTRAKTNILSEYEVPGALKELIKMENIPPVYGGSCEEGDCASNCEFIRSQQKFVSEMKSQGDDDVAFKNCVRNDEENVLKDGYLMKKSVKRRHMNPIWHKRYFALAKCGEKTILRYGKSETTTKFRQIVLDPGTRVMKSNSKPLCIELITSEMESFNRRLILYAETAENQQTWLEAFLITLG